MIDFNTLLVPLDFSPASKAAFERSLELVTGEKPFIVLLQPLPVAHGVTGVFDRLGDEVFHLSAH